MCYFNIIESLIFFSFCNKQPVLYISRHYCFCTITFVLIFNRMIVGTNDSDWFQGLYLYLSPNKEALTCLKGFFLSLNVELFLMPVPTPPPFYYFANNKSTLYLTVQYQLYYNNLEFITNLPSIL
jgi:hypothetical protein